MNDPQNGTVKSLPRISYQYNAHAFQISFPDFESLPSLQGHCTMSHDFACLGHQWRLRLYPGGDPFSLLGMVAVYLDRVSDSEEESTPIKVRFEVGLKKNNKTRATVAEFGEFFDSWRWGNGWDNFEPRSAIIEELDEDGSLVLQVRMGEADPAGLPGQHLIPQNHILGAIRNVFNDEKSFDILIEVGGRDVKETPTRFHVHRHILKECAPILADICEQCDNEHPVQIHGIKPKVFHFLLQYLYGIDIPNNELKLHAKDIIDAADKYGVIGLKLKSEVCYVESATINMDNVIDNLLYANAKNCALLNEAVVDFIIDNSDDVLDKLSFSDVPGDVVLDLLSYISRENKKRSGEDVSSDSMDFNTMRVDALRRMCHERGLDFDGSRKTMITLLKNENERTD